MPKIRSGATRWLLVLLWMCVIFSASSDRMSMAHSSRIIGPLVRWLLPHLSDEAVHATVMFVRKCAHVAEYGVLALLIWRALQGMAGDALRTWRWPDAGRTVLLVLLYAATDELHQAFIPSRGASVLDVLLDTGGGILALFFLWSFGRWQGRWRARGNAR